MFFSQIFAAVLCLSNTAFALPGTGVLQPINVLAFEAAVGLHRRDTTRFTDLTPTEQAQLVYGSAAENGNLLLANMTLTAPSGLLIVMLERLEGLTSAVDCYGDDGELSVTWVDQEAYSSALASWSWVNEDLEAQFLVIVNHEGCGPVGERSAYRITDVDTDEAALKTKLTAVGVAWKEVTGTFSMDFGKMALKRVQRRGLEERGWSDFWNGVKEAAGKTADVAEKAGDALKDTAEKVGDAVKGAVGDVAEDVKDAAKELAKTVGDVFEQVGDADLAEELEFVVSAGQEGVKKNIFTEPFTSTPRIIVDCANCFMVGKLMVSGNLKVEDFKIIDFTLNISPSGFSATTEFNAVIDATYSPEELNSLTKAGKDQKFDLVSLSGSNDLLEIAVPGAGLVVPQIFSLGMIASIETGFAMEFKGKTAFTAGVKATLPDSAKILLDLTDLDKSTATGFEGANAEPIFKVDSASARIDGTLYFRPKFALKAEVMSVGELSANIKVGLPQINAGAEVAFDENGVCEGSPEKTGVRFNLGGAINLVVGLTGQVAGIGGTVERTLASLDLFTSLKKCVPVKIDALAVQSVINAAGNSTWLAPRLVGPRAVRGASQLFRRNY